MAPPSEQTRYFARAGAGKSSRSSARRRLLLPVSRHVLDVDLHSRAGDEIARLHVGRARSGPLCFLDRRRFALAEERRVELRLDFGAIAAVTRVAYRRPAGLLRISDLAHPTAGGGATA